MAVNMRTLFGMMFGVLLMMFGFMLYFTGRPDVAKFILIASAFIVMTNFLFRMVGLRPTSEYEEPFHVHMKP